MSDTSWVGVEKQIAVAQRHKDDKRLLFWQAVHAHMRAGWEFHRAYERECVKRRVPAGFSWFG